VGNYLSKLGPVGNVQYLYHGPPPYLMFIIRLLKMRNLCKLLLACTMTLVIEAPPSYFTGTFHVYNLLASVDKDRKFSVEYRTPQKGLL
jgi:hypothetical protein